MLKRLLVVSLVIAMVMIGVSSIAQAKMLSYFEPLDGDWGDQGDPFVVEQGQYHGGFFARLSDDEDIDVIALTIDAPLEEGFMSFVVTVPECGDHFVDFYPALALIGPGLELPEDDLLAELPFELPEDMGAVVMWEETRPLPDMEERYTTSSYTGRVYSDHELVEVDITEEGEYLLVVWEPDGHAGAYAVFTMGNHPDAPLFPDEDQMRAENRLIETGEWMGWDCDEQAVAQN